MRQNNLPNKIPPQEIIQQTSIFSGPIPSPEILERYEKLLQGSADRILTMAEKEQNTS